MKTRKISRKSRLFNNNPPQKKRSHPKLGYGTRKRALNSLRILKPMPPGAARSAAQTMYFRAKYHKYRTPNMEAAMKVYKDFLNKY